MAPLSPYSGDVIFEWPLSDVYHGSISDSNITKKKTGVLKNVVNVEKMSQPQKMFPKIRGCPFLLLQGGGGWRGEAGGGGENF